MSSRILSEREGNLIVSPALNTSYSFSSALNPSPSLPFYLSPRPQFSCFLVFYHNCFLGCASPPPRLFHRRQGFTTSQPVVDELEGLMRALFSDTMCGFGDSKVRWGTVRCGLAQRFGARYLPRFPTGGDGGNSRPFLGHLPCSYLALI